MDSEKAFEEWWPTWKRGPWKEDPELQKQARRACLEVFDAAWRASGRWHRLAALRECEQLVTRFGFQPSLEDIRTEIRALIAAEERKEEHGRT